MLPVKDEFGDPIEHTLPRTIIVDQPVLNTIQFATPFTNQSIIYKLEKMDAITNNVISTTTVTKTANEEQKVEDLEFGTTYRVTVTPGSSAGNAQVLPDYVTSYLRDGFTVTGVTTNPKEINAVKSYLELSNPNIKDPKSFVLAYKQFDSILIPTNNSVNENVPQHIQSLVKSYEEKYFSFGTSMFMDNNVKNPNQIGGLGFFVSDSGKSGYFIVVESTASSGSNDRKSVRIIKTTPNGKEPIELANSQRTPNSTFDGIYGGKAYNIDVKVKVANQKITIKAYINGFKITASDQNNFSNANNPNILIPPSQNIGLISQKGKTLFDYVYALDIDKARYDSDEYNTNIYEGQFSNDTLDLAYGDVLYNSNYTDDETYKMKKSIEEFGTVVREIMYVKQKFNSRPAFPIKWSTADNKYAKIIGQKISNFGGEAYVLNNTSTTIPLSDGANASFYVFGNDLGESGTLEYTIDDTLDYSYKEPVVFKSSWLQNEADVKKLAEWIKSKVINKGKLLQLNVLGNPMLSVGDIVSVKYLYQGLTGTEKFIITSVSHTFNQGLETSIVCRTL